MVSGLRRREKENSMNRRKPRLADRNGRDAWGSSVTVVHDRKPVARKQASLLHPSGKRTTLGDLLDRALERMDARR